MWLRSTNGNDSSHSFVETQKRPFSASVPIHPMLAAGISTHATDYADPDSSDDPSHVAHQAEGVQELASRIAVTRPSAITGAPLVRQTWAGYPDLSNDKLCVQS